MRPTFIIIKPRLGRLSTLPKRASSLSFALPVPLQHLRGKSSQRKKQAYGLAQPMGVRGPTVQQLKKNLRDELIGQYSRGLIPMDDALFMLKRDLDELELELRDLRRPGHQKNACI